LYSGALISVTMVAAFHHELVPVKTMVEVSQRCWN
jgi:hypothetical protein